MTKPISPAIKVQAQDATGNLVSTGTDNITLAFANNPGFEQNFSHPCAVKLDRQGRVCVLDHIRGRVQVYAKSNDPVLV